MRASSAIKLVSAWCGGLLLSMPVNALKKIYDYREGDDYKSKNKNCEHAVRDSTRYIQVEVFDYNQRPRIKATYRQIADECGRKNFTPYEATMEYDGPDVDDNRLQMDMYICAPFGEYELVVEVKSTNGGKAMEKVAWEVEYGPDEYHIWDTLNTPFFGEKGNFADFSANGALPEDNPYAPIPPAGGDGVTYRWPLEKSTGYYSTLYTGPFPPTECPNLYPAGVKYEGCYKADQPNWTSADGPSDSDSNNELDRAERFRLFDGLSNNNEGLDKGVKEYGVMTIEKCAGMCEEYAYFGLGSAIKCVCGNSISGSATANCGLEDDNEIPEYQYLCSGDSRVLCGTDSLLSIYSFDGSGPGPSPPTPTPAPIPTPPTPTPPTTTSDDYKLLGCSEDNVPKGNRVMTLGPVDEDTMSAEICFKYCMDLDESFMYFGTEYGEECFCSKTVADGLDLEDKGCDMKCANNGGEICGGYNAILVYKIGEATPSEPTPAPADEPTPAPVDEPTPAPVDEPTPAPVDTSGPSNGDGYESLGCFADNQPNSGGKKVRIMGGKTSSESMTPEVCFKKCNVGTNTHFGLQYGEECWCVDDPERKSIDQFSGVSIPCDYECAGDSAEMCGGYNAMSVYVFTGDAAPSEPETPPVPVDNTPTSELYTKEDCYADPRDGDRVLEKKMPTSSSTTMSAQICYDMCVDENASYAFFGLQYGYECWCSTTFAESSETKEGATCDYPCSNNADDICGGYDAITLYEIN